MVLAGRHLPGMSYEVQQGSLSRGRLVIVSARNVRLRIGAAFLLSFTSVCWRVGTV